MELVNKVIASIGGKVAAPAIFGQYETGRSGWPHVKAEAEESPWARDTVEQQCPVTGKGCHNGLCGDPGAYEPYDEFGRSEFNRSKTRNRPAFDSTELREVNVSIYGRDAPPAIYNNVHGQYDYAYYKDFGGARNAFNSTQTQRPDSRSDVPGPPAYTPNLAAIYTEAKVTGGYRSATDRFGPGRFKVMTPTKIGPGTYPQHHHTLYDDALLATRRSSKVKAPFGSTTPQRVPHIYSRDVPDPGYYDILMPRTRDILPTLARKQMRQASRQQSQRAQSARQRNVRSI